MPRISFLSAFFQRLIRFLKPTQVSILLIYMYKISEKMILRKINFYFLLLLLCGICFLYSCTTHHCSDYEITTEEEAFLSAYNQGDIAVFKNDTTGIFDTLRVINKDYGTTHYDNPCNDFVKTSLRAQFNFTYLEDCWFRIWHNETNIANIAFPVCCDFSLSGIAQTLSINGTNYNDVFVTSVDSVTISSIYHNSVPWKIAYSKSKGFVRFYMVNGQTWSKL